MKKLFGLIVCSALVIVTVVGCSGSSSNSPPTTGVYTKQIDYYEDFSTKNNEWPESGNPNLSSIYCRFIDGKYQIVNNHESYSIGATSGCNHRVKDYSVEVDATYAKYPSEGKSEFNFSRPVYGFAFCYKKIPGTTGYDCFYYFMVEPVWKYYRVARVVTDAGGTTYFYWKNLEVLKEASDQSFIKSAAGEYNHISIDVKNHKAVFKINSTEVFAMPLEIDQNGDFVELIVTNKYGTMGYANVYFDNFHLSGTEVIGYSDPPAAYINCPSCYQKIVSDSIRCSQCGYKLPKTQ